MRLLRLSPRSRKLLVWLGGLRLVFEVIDWFVGKVGYLGLFTSPEDFRMMLERAPRWFTAALDAVWPVLITLGSWLRAVWEAASGETGTLVVLGAVVLLLIVDAERLAQVRRNLWFRARRAVSEQVWISRDAAMNVMARSDWGQLVGPETVEPSIFSVSALAFQTRTGLSDADKQRMKFRIYLGRVLSGFAETNPSAYRADPEDGESYDEVALRRFLARAVDAMIAEEFGEPPSYKVT